MMTVKESIDQLLESLTEPRQQQVLDFVRFLTFEDEVESWRHAGQASLARAYGPNEPAYSTADLLEESR